MPPLGEADIHLNSSFKVEDQCPRATNDIVALRNELCKMRVRCEELEQDRNYTAVKVHELQEVVRAFKSDDVLHETLMKKSIQVAEMSMEVDSLHLKIKQLAAENQQLKNEREADKSTMLDLSGVVKSLQCVSFDSDEEEDDDEEEEEVEMLTAEKALDMTLRNMKYQIEGLEDERQRFSCKCKNQSKTIASLTNDNELLGTKVEMLEELFRVLNQGRIEVSSTEQVTTSIEPPLCNIKPLLCKSNSAPHLDARPSKKNPIKRMSSTPRQERVSKTGRMNVVVGDLQAVYTGSLITGSLNEDLPHGTGTFRFKNGDTYLGEVVAGKMHGKGTLYHRAKELGISRGVFNDNVFIGTCNSEAVG
jgi:hypothetical protein